MNPEDVKPLLDVIISITRGVGELANLVSQYQANPSDELLKLFRNKAIELEVQLQIFENRLDQLSEAKVEA